MSHRPNPYILVSVLLALLITGCLRPASREFAGLSSPQARQDASPAPVQAYPVQSPSNRAPTPIRPSISETAPPAPTNPPVPRSTRLVFRLPRQAFPAGLALNGNYQVFLADLEGGSLVPLTPRLGGDLLPVDVSAEEVLVTTGNDLYAAPLEPGEPRLLAKDFVGLEAETGPSGKTVKDSGPEKGAYWLPDGGLVYIGLEGGERAIFRVNADGSDRRRLTRPGEKPLALLPAQDPAGVIWRSCAFQTVIPTQPAASAGGSIAAGSTVTPGESACYHWTSLDGGPARQLWPGTQVAVNSPQGGFVAYHAANGGGWQAVPVYALDAQGRPTGETEPLNVCSLAWSPGGRRLLIGQLFGENFCGWYLLWQPGESELEELPEDLPASYAQLWSPDGGSILFEDWSGAWIYNLVSGSLTPALSTISSPSSGAPASHILWAP